MSRLVSHVAGTALNQQNLKQIAMPVCANGPIVKRGARRDCFNVDEVKRLIVGRIAVEVEERQRAGHGASIGGARQRKRRPKKDQARFVQNFLSDDGSPPSRAAVRFDFRLAVAAAVLTTLAALAALAALMLLAGLVLAALVLFAGLALTALVLLAGLVLAALLRIALLLLRVALRVVLFVRHYALRCLDEPRPTDQRPKPRRVPDGSPASPINSL
jgi:hypothetical protein